MTKKPKHNKKNLTIITSHINADFDALASMLAAQKLYPDALVVFPGSQEKNLRNFFIKSVVYLFNMVILKRALVQHKGFCHLLPNGISIGVYGLHY